MNLVKAICILSTLATVQAECDDEQLKCLPKNHACTDNPEGCCDSLGCFGFGFFKRCQEPPACLEEWNDCSQGMDCCGEFVCAVTATGARECQRRTIDTDVVDPLDGNEKITETKEINTRTTKIPGQPVNTVVGCSVGDPHIYTFGKKNRFNSHLQNCFWFVHSLNLQVFHSRDHQMDWRTTARPKESSFL